MAKHRELDHPLDDLDKQSLEELKLKTEIVKIRIEIQEKNKPWVVKNLAILIPSVIGLGTLLTGYFTGYFNVQAKELAMQKHDLIQDISSFTEKKDSLNQKNKILLAKQNLLLAQTDRLLRDSAHLVSSLTQISNKADVLNKEKEALSLSVAIAKEQKNKLQVEKDKLNRSVSALKTDLSQAPFREYLRKLRDDPKAALNSFYPTLVTLVSTDKAFKEQYQATIKQLIDTTSNTVLKVTLARLMYEATHDAAWKKKLFAMADHFCDTTKSRYANGWNLDFWDAYQFPNTIEERTEVTKFLAGLINRYPNKKEDVKTIFNTIGMMETFVDPHLNFYNTSPKEFCSLIQTARKICVDESNADLDLRTYFFLKMHAPIAFVCIASESLKKPDKFSSYNKTLTINYVVDAIEKNKDVLEMPSGLTSAKSWADWQVKHKHLIDIAFNINQYSNDPATLIKMVGKQ